MMLDQQTGDRSIWLKQALVAKFDSVPQIVFVMLTLIGIAGLSAAISFVDAMIRLVRSDCIR